METQKNDYETLLKRGLLRPGERLDDLERNGFQLIQNPNGFRFGMDAVLLSGFAAVKSGERAVDLGTGSGILPILLAAKTEAAQLIGLEIQADAADMAARSVQLNGLCGRVVILRGDLKALLGSETSYPTAGDFWAESSVRLQPGGFDVVTSNPPYMKADQGLKNPEEAKALSRHELLCSLQDVCFAAGRLLRSGGRFYMVHRPERLTEILAALTAARLAPKRLRFVHPFAQREANMLLVEAVRDGRAGCRIEGPLCIFESPGQYTEEVRTLYRF